VVYLDLLLIAAHNNIREVCESVITSVYRLQTHIQCLLICVLLCAYLVDLHERHVLDLRATFCSGDLSLCKTQYTTPAHPQVNPSRHRHALVLRISPERPRVTHGFLSGTGKTDSEHGSTSLWAVNIVGKLSETAHLSCKRMTM
jgi:hypothetical protein